MEPIIGNFYSPRELFEKYPAISQFTGWTEETLNQFVKDKVLLGVEAGQGYLINFNSFLALIKLVGKVENDIKKLKQWQGIEN